MWSPVQLASASAGAMRWEEALGYAASLLVAASLAMSNAKRRWVNLAESFRANAEQGGFVRETDG